MKCIGINMNSFQMAWRSVIRKPVKSILLIIVVFIISLGILSGMASKNASVELQDKTRQAVGVGFLLEANEENRHKKLDALSKQIGGDKEGSLDGYHQKKIIINGTESWSAWTDHSFETLNIDDIKKLASVSGISDYNVTPTTTAVNPVNFKRIEDSDVDQTNDIGGVALIGNRDMSMDFNVLTGNVTIKEGRMTDKNDENVCVVSEQLANLNNLKVGDKLQFNDYHDKENSKIYEAKIVGIYQVKTKMTSYMSGDTYRSENVIFTDLDFPEKAEGHENDPLYEKAYFKVDDVDEYDLVKKAIKNVDIDWSNYDLLDNNGNLETMSSNFNNLEKISQILIGVIAGASFIILFLIFVFWMKNRVHEVGVLFSLGIPKFKILSQILIEALIISIVAVAISFAAAPATAKITANYLVDQQIQQAKESKEMDIGKVSSDYQEPEQEVTGVRVEITPFIMLFDGISIIVLISLCVIIAGTSILRKKPNKVLSEMS